MTPEDLADIEAIKQVKYRYLRSLDTKHWDDFTDTLAEDIKADYGPSIGNELHFTNRADLVEYMRYIAPAERHHRTPGDPSGDHRRPAIPQRAVGICRTASSLPIWISC